MTSSEKPDWARADSLLETTRSDPHAVSVAELVEVMVRGTPEARTVAAEAYAVVVAARPTVAASVASELRDSIADGDEDVRAGAARTVAHLADDDPEPFRETVEPLLPMLESPVELGREQAVFAVLALSRRFPIDVEPGFSALLRLLEAETEPVEREPHIPGREPNPSGREFGHARAENDVVRFAAARTLRNVATERPETAVEAVAHFGPLLDDRNADVRATACEVFAVVAEERTPAVRPQLGKLVELLVSDPEHPVPWKAASALAELTDEYPEAFADAVVGDADELALFLDDPDPDVRGLGVAFLSYLAEYHPEAVERASGPLRTLLTDENPLIRANAVRTLRTANAVSPADLREVAENDPDPDVRDVAATAVRRLRR
ncbi:HEAT repeat domain-containing protein [Haladaptatus sp. AB618]|uniref:HEAT repeat domain-containing protein n=1 Tax=Haladaptatus sp. AB618 TaxID=2934173 RepID=UPI00209C4E78|nr:HEAT repeat domain-containing protein [Haladaptatus sp. AB618]MCO8254970.1 HEAT repeat domain-containing protein [Haladaptatus sp. AB618]